MNAKNGAFAPTGSACLQKAEIAFRDALQNAFGALDWLPLADGTIHRFHVPGDRAGSSNGWYVLFLDCISSGSFGSWKTGDSHNWCSRQPSSALEADRLRQRIQQARQQREAEQQQRWQEAAKYAQRRWRDARRADPAHAYLIAKQVRPLGLRQHRDRLLVPLYCAGQLVNLQSISSTGEKLFTKGGQVKGCYSPLGVITADKPLYVCEGWATGATLHQHSGAAVACAMNAGNLKPVALALRAKYPSAQLIIAGDDDRQTEGNPGRKSAIEAAQAAGALLTFPEWPTDAPLALSDFNDLQQWQSREAQP